MTKRFHIALVTHDLSATIADYSHRLGATPEIVVDGHYALWRTESLNVSVRVSKEEARGALRHLGWEVHTAEEFTQERDVNGIVWECFTASQQREEIKDTFSLDVE